MRAVATMMGTIVAIAQPAHGEPRRRPDHTVVSLPVMALSSKAFAVQAERPLSRRLSLALTVAARDAADGDYQATSFGLGVEVRVWLRPRQHGLFVAPRVELGRTQLSLSETGRGLGSAIVVGEALMSGYRLVLLHRVEVTPSIGVAMWHDLVQRGVPDATRVSPVFGLSVGWIFR